MASNVQAITKRVALESGGRKMHGEITHQRGNYAIVAIDGTLCDVEVDVRTARPSKRSRDLGDPAAWKVADADAHRLGWGAERDDAKLLPTWKSAQLSRVRIPNPAKSDDVCECGHEARFHGEHLPSACRHGAGPEPFAVGEEITHEGMRRMVEWLERGCRCRGFHDPRAQEAAR